MGYVASCNFARSNLVLTFPATIFGLKISCIQLTYGKVYYENIQQFRIILNASNIQSVSVNI